MAPVPLKVTSTKKKGAYEIKSYDVKKLRDLGPGATLTKLLQLLDSVGAPLMGQGTALGYFNGTEKFRVAFEGDTPVAVHMKGETEDEEKFNKKFGKKGVFGKTGGGQEGGQETVDEIKQSLRETGLFDFSRKPSPSNMSDLAQSWYDAYGLLMNPNADGSGFTSQIFKTARDELQRNEGKGVNTVEFYKKVGLAGGRRSRLNVQRRRTQRNGRGRKSRKLGKLTTRRR